ncbi:uncharacterized protein LOC125179005 [Hyalella azteca]|uniref:Uncharacterized protein LOC125179005 n=1 Tax=Hyalella azteca TaxID=294128 RepID=A0A979FUD8_HYAAZ|nr:uncharacterized protein LOC125179005 [Hyalella azteca]
MAKRGRRRKRLYTTSRYKRASKAQATKTTPVLVAGNSQDPTDGEHVWNEEPANDEASELRTSGRQESVPIAPDTLATRKFRLSSNVVTSSSHTTSWSQRLEDSSNENGFLHRQKNSDQLNIDAYPPPKPAGLSSCLNVNPDAPVHSSVLVSLQTSRNTASSEQILPTRADCRPRPQLFNGNNKKAKNNTSTGCVTASGASDEGSDSGNDRTGTASDRSGFCVDFNYQPRNEEEEDEIDSKSCEDDSDAHNLAADTEKLLSGDAQLKSVASLLNMLQEGKEQQQLLPDDGAENLSDSDYGKPSSAQSKSLRLLKMKLEDSDNTEFDLGSFQRRRRIAFTPRQYKLLQTTFEHNNFPEPSEQRSISLQLGAPYRSIKMWFQNKRAAVRKRLGPDAPRAAGSPRTKYKNASDANSCFYCDLCPAAFIALPFLKRHKEYHQIKTYNCSDCNAAFTHSDLLTTHSRAKCREQDKQVDGRCGGSSDAKKLRSELKMKLNRVSSQAFADAADIDTGNLSADAEDGSEVEVVDLCDGPQEPSSGVPHLHTHVPKLDMQADSKSSSRSLMTTVLNIPKLPALKFLSYVGDGQSATDKNTELSADASIPNPSVVPVPAYTGFGSPVSFESSDRFPDAPEFMAHRPSEDIEGLKILAEQCLVHASSSGTEATLSQPIDLHKPRPLQDHLENNRSLADTLEVQSNSINSTPTGESSGTADQQQDSLDEKAGDLCDNSTVVKGAKIQARVTMLPISAATALDADSVPMFARSLPLIAALHQMSKVNAQHSREMSGSYQHELNGDTEHDSTEEVDLDDEKAELLSGDQREFCEDDGETAAEGSHKPSTEQIIPAVRNQLLQQALLNQIKQHQKHEQNQVLHKLSKYYAGVSGNNTGEIISSSPDLTIRRQQEPSLGIKNEMILDNDESNQLKFGNLTIYPIKCKPKIEPASSSQPIDLSSRATSQEDEESSGMNLSSDTGPEISVHAPRQQLMLSFHQNLLKILANQSTNEGPATTESDNSDADTSNSLALLPFLAGAVGGLPANALIKSLLSANILLNAAHTTPETENNPAGLEPPSTDAGTHISSGAFKEKIFSALLSQLINKNNNSVHDQNCQRDGSRDGLDFDAQAGKANGSSCSATTTTTTSGGRPQRRRTTVFSETQHRILYQHFTHCNFPEPAMFRILAKLIGLDAAVIKIWFQNERSRQRKRASFIMEGNKSFADKPYKCMDCDMSFAMATFLVKHSARHSLHDQSQTKTRTCPICSLRFETDAYNEHLRSVHQVDMMLEEVKPLDEKEESENLTCYLCQKSFEDPEALFIHKKDHLISRYGSVASCSICDSSFVNAICLEAHMQTHYKLEWNYECSMCRSRFPEEILLRSHTMSHGIPAPAISSVNRYRSQTQECQKKSIIATPNVASSLSGPDLTTLYTNDNSKSNGIDAEKMMDSEEVLRKPILGGLLAGNPQCVDTKFICNSSSSSIQLPIQISTSQVTSTQAGTPLAIRTTDAEGRSIIQLLPVQLVPAVHNPNSDSSSDNLFNARDASSIDEPQTLTSTVTPKTKKKLPDLIPICEYQTAARNIREQIHGMTNTREENTHIVQSRADSILKSYITGTLPRVSGIRTSADSSTTQTENAAFPSLVKIEPGFASSMDSKSNLNVESPGTECPDSKSNSGRNEHVSNDGAHLVSPLSSLGSPGGVRVVDCSQLTSSHHDSFSEENSKLFNLLSQGLHLSKANEANDYGNSEDEPHEEMNLGPCNRDSDGTGSDDELVIDLKEGNESHDSENEDSKDLAAKIRSEMAASALNPGNVKVNLQLLRSLNLDSLNCNADLKKYVVGTIQQIMKLREEEMLTENERECDSVLLQNDDGALPDLLDGRGPSLEDGRPEEQQENKKYRNRREYTQDEQLILLAHFQHNHFPPTRELKLLAKRLNITHRQIMHWFQNRRSKERKSLPYSRRVSRQCSDCKATFVHDEGLASHKAESHDPSSVAVQFVCPVKSCMMSFPSAVLLQTHELLHDKKDAGFRKCLSEMESTTVKKTRRILPKKLHMEGFNSSLALKIPGLSSSSCSPYTSPMSSPPLPSFLSLKPKLLGTRLSLPGLEGLSLPGSNPATNMTSTYPVGKGFPVVKSPTSTASEVGATAPNNNEVTSSAGNEDPAVHIINKLHLNIESKFSHGCGVKAKTSPRWSFGSLTSPDSSMPAGPASPMSSAASVCNLASESLAQLNFHFQENNFPSPQELLALSREFGLDVQSLSAWYKSQRQLTVSKELVGGTSISCCWSPTLSGGAVFVGSDSETEQTCPMCSAAFVTKRDLQQHIRLHSDPAAFTCDVCHAVFRHECVYGSHAAEHAVSACGEAAMSTTDLLAVRSPPPKCPSKPRESGHQPRTQANSSQDCDSKLTKSSKKASETEKIADENVLLTNEFEKIQANNCQKSGNLRVRKSLDSVTSRTTNKKTSSFRHNSEGSKLNYKANSNEKLVCRRSSSGCLIISKLSAVGNTGSGKRPLDNDDINSSDAQITGLKSSNEANVTYSSPTTPKFRTVFASNERSLPKGLNGVKSVDASAPNERSAAGNRVLPTDLLRGQPSCSGSKGELKLSLKLPPERAGCAPTKIENNVVCEGSPPLEAPSLSGKQLKILETHYESNNLPRGPELRLISRHSSLPVSSIVRWYSGRRQREREELNKVKQPVSRVQCPHCNSCFISKVKLAPHIQLHLAAHEETGNACETCGAQFPNEVLLETHLFCHGLKTYKLYLKKKKIMNAKERKEIKSAGKSAPPRESIESSDSTVQLKTEMETDLIDSSSPSTGKTGFNNDMSGSEENTQVISQKTVECQGCEPEEVSAVKCNRIDVSNPAPELCSTKSEHFPLIPKQNIAENNESTGEHAFHNNVLDKIGALEKSQLEIVQGNSDSTMSFKENSVDSALELSVQFLNQSAPGINSPPASRQQEFDNDSAILEDNKVSDEQLVPKQNSVSDSLSNTAFESNFHSNSTHCDGGAESLKDVVTADDKSSPLENNDSCCLSPGNPASNADATQISEELLCDDEEGEPLPEGEVLDSIITTYTISQYIAEEEKQQIS